MQTNASYIFSFLTSEGWTRNAVAALLGNMQAESSINPGRWQSDNVGNTSAGYGLVQWTPATKYFNWCDSEGHSDPSEMDANLSRILYEVANGGQWYATDSYDLTFEEFTKSTADVKYLARSFLLNYERPADQSESVQSYRGSLGAYWYSYLSGETPSEPSDPSEPSEGETKKRKRYNFLLFNANKRRNQRQWTKTRF